MNCLMSFTSFGILKDRLGVCREKGGKYGVKVPLMSLARCQISTISGGYFEMCRGAALGLWMWFSEGNPKGQAS